MQTSLQRCLGCDQKISLTHVPPQHSAYCARCHTRLQKGETIHSQGEMAVAIAALILFFPAQYFPLVEINLLGENFTSNIFACSFSLFKEGFIFPAILTFFCTTFAPFCFVLAVLFAQWGLLNRKFLFIKCSTWILKVFRNWVMLDVFVVALAITSFKVTDYADFYIKTGIFYFIGFQFFLILLVIKVDVHRYWRIWQPRQDYHKKDQYYCYECHLSQPAGTHCVRCHSKLHKRKPFSLQHTSALLLSALVCFLPANLLPMTIILSNGKRLTDTIFSGVITLCNIGSYGIAAVIFTASILVPFIKIIGLSFILLKIRYYPNKYKLFSMKVYRFIKFIGKWSMMDVFVVALMMTLLDRGQILDFVPGSGATAFALVVFLTMLATESLDTRLIWDKHDR